MTRHDFVGGDIHRQFVEWDNGARIWVNRGETDWAISGHTLPQYGYYAEFGDGGVVALEVVDRQFREYSKTATSLYCNVRSDYMNAKAALFADAQPMLGGLTLSQNGNLPYELHWKVKAPTADNADPARSARYPACRPAGIPLPAGRFPSDGCDAGGMSSA